MRAKDKGAIFRCESCGWRGLLGEKVSPVDRGGLRHAVDEGGCRGKRYGCMGGVRSLSCGWGRALKGGRNYM